MSRSSRGLGHRPFTAVTGVRLPYGTPVLDSACAGIAQLVERYLAKVQVAGSSPVSRSIIRQSKIFLIGHNCSHFLDSFIVLQIALWSLFCVGCCICAACRSLLDPALALRSWLKPLVWSGDGKELTAFSSGKLRLNQ